MYLAAKGFSEIENCNSIYSHLRIGYASIHFVVHHKIGFLTIETTHNAAEQALRPAVLWRRCSYGSQSAAGSLFVARLMAVVTTLRSHQRHVLDC